MAAIDAAVLVVSARDGVEAQTELLLSMLEARRLPFAVFVNKCDLEPDPSAVTAALLSRIGREVLSCNTPAALPSPTFEEDAVTALSDEALLESYLAGTLPEERLICFPKNGSYLPSRRHVPKERSFLSFTAARARARA